MKEGFKVVWRAAAKGAVAKSVNWQSVDSAAREYRAGQPVEPAPEAGPLHVFATYEDAASFAGAQARFKHWSRPPGCYEVWAVEWLPWDKPLPRTERLLNQLGEPAALAGWSDRRRMDYISMALLPRNSRLARQVILRQRLCQVWWLPSKGHEVQED